MATITETQPERHGGKISRYLNEVWLKESRLEKTRSSAQQPQLSSLSYTNTTLTIYTPTPQVWKQANQVTDHILSHIKYLCIRHNKQLTYIS